MARWATAIHGGARVAPNLPEEVLRVGVDVVEAVARELETDPPFLSSDRGSVEGDEEGSSIMEGTTGPTRLNLEASPTRSTVSSDPVTRAYVTLLDGESLDAVVRLAEALRKVGAAYPLVVAVLPGVPEYHRDILVSRLGCVVREVEPVYHPPGNQQFAMASHCIVNCSKLRVWEFVEYERIVYLDAGIRVLENIDDLFELDKGHFYYAAKLSPPPYFNTGMFVHEPSVVTADALRVTPPTSFPDDEQDFMNVFFKDQYKPIPLERNLVEAMLLGHAGDESKRPWGKKLPQFGRWLTAKTSAFARQNPAAMATLAASSAAVGVITTSAANPAICFGFYTVFLAAIATITISLRGK